MDRSVDSIGSCSLDVDADSTDVSDTSGSLNFPTPISIKDITTEFTTNIRERCSVQTFHEINKNFMGLESQMVLKQPIANVNTRCALLNSSNPNSNKIISQTDSSTDKKPSYLNLACCVNGYSNLTTYDSKIRQDINKSREVSPIRPSSNSIQYCKKSNSLAPPILLQMDDGRGDVSNSKPAATNGLSNNGYNNTENNEHCDSPWNEDGRNTSFIQQRVERLYGRAALAQGFYSPKKVRSTFSCTSQRDRDDAGSSELARKFQQLTPSKDYSEFRKKLDASANNSPRQVSSATEISTFNNNIVDLPVLRHLSQEFRAQLPIISPKKNQSRSSLHKALSSENDTTDAFEVLIDEVDRKEIPISLLEISNEHPNGDNIQYKIVEKSNLIDPSIECSEKNGNYFLHLLKSEQSRLLALADKAERYADELSGNPEISEDTLGFLRSAYGKARLLVSQKMKQFEGLCQNNLNSSPQDKFPTTNDDLQGFWDMVNLQVDHINSIFDEIEVLRQNNWKKPMEILPKEPTKIQPKTVKTVNQKTKVSTSNGNDSKTKSVLSAAALKRESQRKMLLEMKRKNKIALAAKSTTSVGDSVEPLVENLDTVEIFVKHTN
ncbi:disks large-associated protein 4 isoform X1 [Zeugodacus cucurbitae]|uniref:Disks large-associated protein 2 n=1 Tax=Zeugodacus cucurbitae TaxID=28588 RepID=A0A0A1XCM4_ZEUCU|nr:disks large-associated protein 4 isoform X1 [Zeugodacus cucurbitae]XP_011193189.2 disks large-associated protein 4 isoform X1 [Zeugodacus cucurbitae]XP_011193190.2 disks large-associated protein 4 isoform X1 [Zeugodacus cucurbitae]